MIDNIKKKSASEKERDGGFIKQEGATSELEMDLSPRL